MSVFATVLKWLAILRTACCTVGKTTWMRARFWRALSPARPRLHLNNREEARIPTRLPRCFADYASTRAWNGGLRYVTPAPPERHPNYPAENHTVRF